MLESLCRALGALASLAALSVAAPAAAEWHKAENAHFIIYADMSEAALARFADRLERFDAAMRVINGASEPSQVTLYVVNDIGEVSRLAGSRGVGGFYRPSAQEALIVVPGETGADARSFDFTPQLVLQHEYAHHMMLTSIDQVVPAWATEGMAEFFGTADIKGDGSVVLGATPTYRGFELASQGRWSARELLLAETRRVPRSESTQRYAKGWLLVHYLLLGGERGKQYTDYINALDGGKSTEEAAQEVFGDLGRLDADMNRYIRRSRVPGVALTPAQLGTMSPVTITALSPGAAAIMPYRITSAIGVSEETAGPLADKALPVAARYPGDAFVERSLAEIMFDAKKYDEAIAAADRAIAVDPNNVMAMVYRGRALVERAGDDPAPEVWREARSWFLRANRANPNHGQPFVSYYDSFDAAGETPSQSAITGLLRAVVVAPQDEALRRRVAVLRLRSGGNLQEVRQLLSASAFNPHAGEENPARDAVKLIDDGATAEAILAGVGEKLVINEFLEAPEDEDEEEGGDEA